MAKLNIIVGSVYGNAQHAAETVAEALQKDGVDCEVFEDASVTDFTHSDALLVITSTTGQGDIPPNLEMTFFDLKEQFPLLEQKPFAVAALGDSSYTDTFCGGGRQFQELLTELQGKPVADMLEVDAMETLDPENEVLQYVKRIQDDLLA